MATQTTFCPTVVRRSLTMRGFRVPAIPVVACKGCGSTDHGPLGGTLKCVDCVRVDIHNYTALHDGRYKTRQYPTRKVQS